MINTNPLRLCVEKVRNDDDDDDFYFIDDEGNIPFHSLILEVCMN